MRLNELISFPRAEMTVNMDPLRILETFDADALIKEDFTTIMEMPDCIRVQGECLA